MYGSFISLQSDPTEHDADLFGNTVGFTTLLVLLGFYFSLFSLQSDPAEHGAEPDPGAHLPAAARALRLPVAVPRSLRPHPLLLHSRIHVHVPGEPARLRPG